MQRVLVRAEGVWDSARRRRRGPGPPRRFRIETYIGHGGPTGVIIRGRVLDDPPPSPAVEGEGVVAAVRRSLRQFVTTELPGVPLQVTVGDRITRVASDDEGYFIAQLDLPTRPEGPWIQGTVELAGDYRGLTDSHPTPIAILVPDVDARFGVISDVDDTIIETGVQRVSDMVLQTLTGSAITRTPFAGAAELYRDLSAEINPFFYVSSSPWNLHAFLLAFLRHREFPIGPLLLRDLVGGHGGRARKHDRIEEILRLHPQLPFVLIGDSGEKDPQIYADIVNAHPGRILAVYIREVRLDPGDGRVEQVTADWAADVPFVLAADSDAVRRHAASIGLLSAHQAGAYWSAVRVESDQETEGPPPWVSTEPRSATNPFPLRMFAEDGCEFALWGPIDEKLPGHPDLDPWGRYEELLPITAELRERLIAWARAHVHRSERTPAELEDEGLELSRELARQLGELYSVKYGGRVQR